MRRTISASEIQDDGEQTPSPFPAPTKTHVATIERGDNRAIPQTPCPLVHPEPSDVPKPTRSPAMVSSIAPAETFDLWHDACQGCDNGRRDQSR